MSTPLERLRREAKRRTNGEGDTLPDQLPIGGETPMERLRREAEERRKAEQAPNPLEKLRAAVTERARTSETAPDESEPSRGITVPGFEIPTDRGQPPARPRVAAPHTADPHDPQPWTPRQLGLPEVEPMAQDAAAPPTRKQMARSAEQGIAERAAQEPAQAPTEPPQAPQEPEGGVQGAPAPAEPEMPLGEVVKGMASDFLEQRDLADGPTISTLPLLAGAIDDMAQSETGAYQAANAVRGWAERTWPTQPELVEEFVANVTPMPPVPEAEPMPRASTRVAESSIGRGAVPGGGAVDGEPEDPGLIQQMSSLGVEPGADVSPVEFVKHLGNQIVQSLASWPNMTATMARVLAEDWQDIMFGFEGMPEDEPMTDLTRRLESWTGDVREKAEEAFPSNPDLANSFWFTKFPQGATSTLPFMAGGIAAQMMGGSPMFAAGGMGALVEGGGAYQEAEEAGAPEDVRRKAAMMAMIGGFTEGIPISRGIGRFMGGQGALSIGLKEMGEESLQEGFQGTLGNWIASQTYDPDRGLFEGVPEGMAIGGLVGWGMGAGGAAVGRRVQSARQTPADRYLGYISQLGKKYGGEYNTDWYRTRVEELQRSGQSAREASAQAGQELDAHLRDEIEANVTKQEAQQIDRLARAVTKAEPGDTGGEPMREIMPTAEERAAAEAEGGPSTVTPPPDIEAEPATETPEEKPSLRRRIADRIDPSRAEELDEAYRDPLTGLPNQTAFRAAQERIDADPERHWLSVDLTNFKAINDNEGRAAGDARLSEVAEILREEAEARGVETRDVQRAGGDEFAVNHTDPAVLQEVLEATQERVPDIQIGEFTSTLRGAIAPKWAEATDAANAQKATEEGPRARDVKVTEGEAGPEATVAGPEAEEVTEAAGAAPPAPVTGEPVTRGTTEEASAAPPAVTAESRAEALPERDWSADDLRAFADQVEAIEEMGPDSKATVVKKIRSLAEDAGEDFRITTAHVYENILDELAHGNWMAWEMEPDAVVDWTVNLMQEAPGMVPVRAVEDVAPEGGDVAPPPLPGEEAGVPAPRDTRGVPDRSEEFGQYSAMLESYMAEAPPEVRERFGAGEMDAFIEDLASRSTFDPDVILGGIRRVDYGSLTPETFENEVMASIRREDMVAANVPVPPESVTPYDPNVQALSEAEAEEYIGLMDKWRRDELSPEESTRFEELRAREANTRRAPEEAAPTLPGEETGVPEPTFYRGHDDPNFRRSYLGGRGMWLSTSPKEAGRYGKNVTEVRLAGEPNLLDLSDEQGARAVFNEFVRSVDEPAALEAVDFPSQWEDNWEMQAQLVSDPHPEWIAFLESKGYEGIIGPGWNGPTEAFVFDAGRAEAVPSLPGEEAPLEEPTAPADEATRQDDIFGGRGELQGSEQRGLGLPETPVTLEREERLARQTVDTWRELIEAGKGTEATRQRYFDALRLLRRKDKLSEAEVRQMMAEAEAAGEAPERQPDDTGDLFEGEAPAVEEGGPTEQPGGFLSVGNLVEGTKSVGRRFFLSRGDLPNPVFKKKLKADGWIKRMLIQADYSLEDFNLAAREVYGRGRLDDDQLRTINAALQGTTLEEAPVAEAEAAELEVARSERIEVEQELAAVEREGATEDPDVQVGREALEARAVEARERFRTLREQYVEAREERAQRAIRALPEELRPIVVKMRVELDALSRRMIDNGLVEGEMAAVVEDHMGVYLNRSYRVFDDPKWADNVPKEVRNKAKALIRRQYPHLSDNQVEGMIEELLFRGEKDAPVGPVAALARSGSKLGSKNLSILKRRKDIAPEIRALWGEYENPMVNYTRSMERMTRLIANHEFLESVAQEHGGEVVAGEAAGGMDAFFYDEPIVGPDGARYVAQIAAEGSSVMAPLNGKYTTPQIKDAFERAMEPSGALPWYLRHYMKLNASVKVSKTILSPMTHVRNTIANVGFATMNGHWRVAHQGEAWANTLSHVAKMPDAERRELYLRLTELNVVSQSVRAGELDDVLNDAIKVGPDEFSNSLVQRGSRKGMDVANSLYQAEDDVWKIYGFLNEGDRYSKALGVAMDQPVTVAGTEYGSLEERVAEMVRNTYPSYALVPEFVKQLRKMPMLGTFPSFTAEVVRTTYHSLNYTRQELADPRLRKIGAERLAGQIATATAIGAAATASRMLLGMTADDDDDVREFVAPWTENSTLYYIGRGEGGRFKFVDFSYTDPHAYFRKPLIAFMRGEDWESRIFDPIFELAEPFFGEEILWQAWVDVSRNQKENGAPVYNTEAPIDDKVSAVTRHLWRAFEPGAVSSGRRIYMAAKGEPTEYGREYDLLTEIIANAAGTRIQDLNVSDALPWRVRDTQRQLDGAQRLLTSVAYSRGEVSDEELREAYMEAERAKRKLLEEAHETAAAAIRLGVPEDRVRSILRDEFSSTKLADQVFENFYQPYVPSDRFLGGLDPGVAERRRQVIREAANDLEQEYLRR